MFLLNSRYPLFFLCFSTLLFPKLRSNFAEFLQYYSLFCLSLFNLFTCVRVSTANLLIFPGINSIDKLPQRLLAYLSNLYVESSLISFYDSVKIRARVTLCKIIKTKQP